MSRHLGRWVEPLLLVTIAVGIFVDSLSYPSAVVPGAPGPAFFPRLLSLVLAACAGWLAWRPPGAAGLSLGGSDSTGGSIRFGSAIVLIAGFLLLASRLDTYVLLPLLVGGLMAIMGERRVPALAGIPILFTLFVYLVFVQALGVPLPARLS
jgi:hypothetical protein